MGPGMMGGGMMGRGMGPGAAGADAGQAGCYGMGAGAMRGAMAGQCATPAQRGPGGGQSLFTPEERQAMQEGMRNATTPEQRQQIAQAHRAEMQRRAQEQGVAVPGPRGPRGRWFGPNAAPANPAPAATEQAN